jgi:hypothetical protein
MWHRITHGIGRAAIVGLLALTPLLTGSVSVAAAAQGNQGLQDGWAIDNDGKFTGGLHLLADGEFTYMKNAGAGWTRINFRLGNCYHDWTTPVPQSAIDSGLCHPSTLNRTAADQYVEVVRAARAQGLRVLGLLSNESLAGQPSDWIANNAEHNASADGNNPYIQSFASAAGLLAARFKAPLSQHVDEWEIWNEPNAYTDSPTPGVYTGGSFIYPSNFAQLLKRSYDAIKKVAPGAVVISGGLFGHDPAGATVVSVQPNGVREQFVKRGAYTPTAAATARGATASRAVAAPTTCTSTVPSGADYLCQTYLMGRARAQWRNSGPFDQIGQHLYIDQGGPTSAAKVAQFLSDVRQTYVAFEGSATAKKTEITEFGWNTLSTGITQPVQAQNLTTAYSTYRTTPYVRRAFWFRTQDLPWDEHGLIAFESNGTAQPKPSFAAYQQSAAY